MIRFTPAAGGEEAATGQTTRTPRPGQAPQNEKEKGLSGKVRALNLCHNFLYYLSSLLSFGSLSIFNFNWKLSRHVYTSVRGLVTQ